ncbi:DUF4965 domain-containing protein [Paenibacillus sp. PL2-23]|uniref:glutaminase family protein n=1 Tax=Paenibacillus sp. PL2-23 TaxID=2100729 RepID=UPI0030FA3F82
MKTLRPPSVPLVTVDPYFSIWSPLGRLTERNTQHWTRKQQALTGLIRIDGKAFRFMGKPSGNVAHTMQQVSLRVEPLTSQYVFQEAGIELTLSFTTPLLMDDLDILSRPASYVSFRLQSIDGITHRVELYFDLSANVCVHTPQQEVDWERTNFIGGIRALKVGTTSQKVLHRKGDDVRIDWGYAYLVVPPCEDAATAIGSEEIRSEFIEEGSILEQIDSRKPRLAEDEAPNLAVSLSLENVGAMPVERYLVLAYDDIMSVDYFGKQLPGYWRRNGMSAEEMMVAAVLEYDDLMKRVGDVNREVMQQARIAGGEKYAEIAALAYRQAIAAHKLVAAEDGSVLFFSKENFSNGCMATVDVSYPSLPLFLLYNPELAKGMLRPIFAYASSDAWTYPFAPHDVGTYPHATGQEYGLELERQMPVEECGNMLIMAAAIALAEGDGAFAKEHWDLLSQWAFYLRENGLDPGNQLCTDDFAGHLAHNTNLSIKAIMGIAGYGILCGILGDVEGKEAAIREAREMASQWEQLAREDDHYKLAFDQPGTWSLKYNLIWDRLFQLNVFNEEISRQEIALYLKKKNKYGTPLDSRCTYTKADWLIWAASLSESAEEFGALTDPLWDFLNESMPPVPFTDWYLTIDGRMVDFINRSVVGGVFMKVLVDNGIRAYSKN